MFAAGCLLLVFVARIHDMHLAANPLDSSQLLFYAIAFPSNAAISL